MDGSNEGRSGGRAYSAGIAVAVLASLVTVWTTIVRDDGNGIGFFAPILAAGIAGFAARFDAAGLARGMFGVAGMVVLIGIAIATAPITASEPDGPVRILVASAGYTGFWLISALCFLAAARRNRGPAAVPA